jgi:ferric-dicitrate binding protein FerR (iron transport regulator)
MSQQAYRALTRLRSAARAHEHVYKAVERSLGKLGTEYLDAYYIHSPLASPAQRAKAWCVGGVREGCGEAVRACVVLCCVVLCCVLEGGGGWGGGGLGGQG